LRLGGESVVFQAQRVEQGVGRITATTLDFRSVAVDVGLVKLAQIEIALDGPVVGDGVAAVEGKELRLISRGLRPGEDRPVVVIEKLNRRGTDPAEKICGRARDQMDLAIGAFPAKIAVEAGDPRRRLVTPAVILAPLRGKVEAPFSIPDAVLQPTAEA